MEPFIERLKERGIKSTSVLAALNTVQYYNFLEEEQKKQAFGDMLVPMDLGAIIERLYIIAYIMEKVIGTNVDLIPKKVLEIGTGNGYQAACLAEIVREVYTIERSKEAYERAEALFRDLRVVNAYQRYGDGFFGWPESAPFDAIIVNIATNAIPEALKEQLADGGRMVVPIGGGDNPILYLITRTGNEFKKIILPETGQFKSFVRGIE